VAANRRLDATGAPEGVIGLEPTALATSTEEPPSDTWRGALALPSLAPGDLFDGRYRIEKLVGTGGMAIVYCARHIALGQLRALKLVLPSRLTGPDAVEQLRRESVATSRIHHPNVVRHVDFGRSLEGHYYITLDFVDGPSLAQVVRDEGRLPEAEALRIGDQILAGLQAAHALNIIHRDLKPANVLLDASRQARVTDFGLAQPPGIDLRLIAGTPAYMSPEQLRGAHVDERSDLYSFGATIYQLLTGVLPYRSLEGSITDLRGHDDRVPLGERTGDVSSAVCALIDRCLAASPEHRPASAAALRRALRDAGSRS
jgi:eukaryotic-like serine/threonine-protein kinase